jgi:hypothetical protein
LALVSTVAPPIVAVLRPPAAAAAGLLALLAGEEAEEGPAELHAASAAAAAAAAGSARSIRRRAGPLLIRCALAPRLRPGIVRIVMTSCPLCRVCQHLAGETGWVEMFVISSPFASPG